VNLPFPQFQIRPRHCAITAAKVIITLNFTTSHSTCI